MTFFQIRILVLKNTVDDGIRISPRYLLDLSHITSFRTTCNSATKITEKILNIFLTNIISTPFL